MNASPGPSTTVAEPVKQRKTKGRRKGNGVFLSSADEINSRWKTKEKIALLKALEKFGTSDTDKLAAEIKTRNPDQVKYFIDCRMIQARKTRFKATNVTDIPIDQWIANIDMCLMRKTDYSTALCEVLSNCTHTKYASIYKYLAELTVNDVPGLPEDLASCAVLQRLIQDLAQYVNPLNLEHIHETLARIVKVPASSSEMELDSSEAETMKETAGIEMTKKTAGVEMKKESDGAETEEGPLHDDIYRLYEKGLLSSGEDNFSLNPLGITPSIMRALFFNNPDRRH